MLIDSSLSPDGWNGQPKQLPLQRKPLTAGQLSPSREALMDRVSLGGSIESLLNKWCSGKNSLPCLDIRLCQAAVELAGTCPAEGRCISEYVSDTVTWAAHQLRT